MVGTRYLTLIYCIVINLIKSQTEIWIQHPTQGSYAIETDLDASIHTLQQHIKELFNLNPAEYQLSFAQMPLNRHSASTLLSDLGIGSEATVHMQFTDRIPITFTFARRWETPATAHDYDVIHYEPHTDRPIYVKIHSRPRQTVTCSLRTNERSNFIKDATQCLLKRHLVEETDSFFFVVDDKSNGTQSPVDKAFIVEPITYTGVGGHVVAKLTDRDSLPFIPEIQRSDALKYLIRIGGYELYEFTNHCTLDNMNNWFNGSILAFIGQWKSETEYNIYFKLPPHITINFVQSTNQSYYDDEYDYEDDIDTQLQHSQPISSY